MSWHTRERAREDDEEETTSEVSSRTCPECEGDQLITHGSQGELLCEECGLIIEENITGAVPVGVGDLGNLT